MKSTAEICKRYIKAKNEQELLACQGRCLPMLNAEVELLEWVLE